jgi:hypothetical protein
MLGGSLGTPPGGDIAPGSGANAEAGPAPSLTSPVSVIITADNAYGFGYGTSTNIANYFGGVENIRSGDIFDCPGGPETYTVPASDANAGDFLYIVGYADKSTTQGVIGMFFRDGGAPVYTGLGAWQVCATGADFDPGSGGPMLPEINAQLALCNAGNTDLATTSGGWRSTEASAGGSLAFGEMNTSPRGTNPTPGNEFNVACGIDPGARWMWYEWEPQRATGSPFIWPGGQRNVTKDFLIFRLGAEFIPSRIN